MENIKLGIIGLGGIAERFATVMAGVEGVELAAVAARDKPRAEAFAARHAAAKKSGAAKVAAGYRELIADSGVDAVYIALTHNFHYEIARLCLESGKAVLCEKPLVLGKGEAESLRDLSRRKRVLLMEAMWTRCIPAFRTAKEWARAGRIGSVKLIEAAFCFKAPYDPEGRLFNPDLAGGGLYDAGVYPIEFATGILGENPTKVVGAAHVGATGVDEYAAISLGFASGAVASLACGITAAAMPRDARVFGDGGSIVVYDFLGPRRCELFDPDGKRVDYFEQGFADGFIYEIEHFRDLFAAGKIESDLIPLADNVACAGVFDSLMGQWGLR